MLMWLCAVLARVDDDDRGAADDRVYVRRMAAGDPSALAALYDRHGRALYSLALRIVRDEGEAEDLVQEVFAEAWRRSASYEPSRGAVVAWLLTMTRSRAIDRVRARRARPNGRAAFDEAAVADVAAPAAGPVDQIAAAEDARRIRAALDDLPFAQRLAIELAYFEGLTQREIAERLEEPIGTVKTRIRLGLLRLRDALTEGRA
jgi:RNA polymerase sigma-70 factor (ECF subfamily)